MQQKESLVGIKIVKNLISEGVRIFTIDQLRIKARDFQVNEDYVIEMIYHLKTNNWIYRIKNGLYAISNALLHGTPIHEFEIAMHLAPNATISHLSALYHHHMTDQIPHYIYIMSFSDHGHRFSNPKISGVEYIIDNLGFNNEYGIEKIWQGEVQILIADKERSLLNAIIRPEYNGGFTEVLHIYKNQIKNIDLDKMINYTLQQKPIIIKRVGYLLDQLGVEEKYLSPLLDKITKGYRNLNLCGANIGSYNDKWQIRVNI